jgi:hypothetical protein
VTSSPHPNVVLRGGPQPVGPRQIHITEPVGKVRWRAADGSGLHEWTRTGEHEEHGGVMLRVYVYSGVAGPDATLHGWVGAG